MTKSEIKELFCDLLRDVAIAAVLVFVLFRIIFNLVIVSGASMYPTIDDGSVVIGQHLGFVPERDPTVGMLPIEHISCGYLFSIPCFRFQFKELHL